MFGRMEANPGACSLRMLLLTELTADRALAALVPINALRNAALLAIRTPLVAMIDVDLAISGSLLRVLEDSRRCVRARMCVGAWRPPARSACVCARGDHQPDLKCF
jgi:hypothetical protein